MGATRRAILITGGAAVVVAGGWALTRAPRQASEPWRKAAEGFGDARLDALAYAILAPNPHNMQPWRIRLDGDDAFTLYADLQRLLPRTDPFNRQIVIGFGCFLEMVRQATAEKGHRAEIALFPEGEPQPHLDARPIARVRLLSDEEVAPDPLFEYAPRRRTNRLPFARRDVPTSALAAAFFPLGFGEKFDESVAPALFDATAQASLVAELRALAREAWRIEWRLARMRAESLDVTRIGKRAIEKDPWGLAFSGPDMEILSAIGAVSRGTLDDPGSVAYREAFQGYDAAIESARAFVWIRTQANDRSSQIEAGRIYMRLCLSAERAGLAVHPLSQALQEFPEMAGPYGRAHELLAPDGGGTIQMLARVGYAGDVPPAPREPLEAKLVPA
jgi:nitroreductase